MIAFLYLRQLSDWRHYVSRVFVHACIHFEQILLL